MERFKILVSKSIYTFCFLFCFLSISLNAQDRTAAGAYNEGLELLKAKNYADAIPLMEEAIKLAQEGENDQVIKLASKNGAIGYYKLGSTQRKAKNLEEAMKSFQRGIELNEKSYSNYLGVAQVLDAQGKRTEAVTAYLNAAAKAAAGGKADKEVSLTKKAQNLVGVAFSNKKWTETIEAGDAFLAVTETSEVHYYLSKAQNEAGDNTKAVEHAEKAINLAGDKDPSKYYMAKASALEAQKKKDAAIAAYKMVTGEKYKERAAYKIQQLGGTK